MKDDAIAGAVSLSLGIFFILLSRDLPVFVAKGYPGPSFFPLILSSSLLLCGLILITRFYRGMKMGREDNHLRQDTELLRSMIKDTPFKNAIKFLVLAFIYILLIPYIGFLLTSMLFTFITQVIYRVPVLKALAISFAAVFSVYLLFIMILRVVVPEPILGALVFR
ncbi:MAG TPA: tripartite tricarboxylate transporter TctB family protein [Sulfolobales archaeon]|nr:tripartite tricarboxylate transporter TctB family protein [Sulfolobales archaeon]